MLTFKQILAKNYINARGWRTSRKLLLIESDDWGAIRMPSRKAYEFFLSKNIAVDQSNYDRNDSLESAEDLESLFEVLNGFRDINGNPAVITAFSVVANPDFEKIEADKRQQYHYELITETYKRNPHTEKSFGLFREGAEKRLLYPQFHGREHLHTKRWIEAINSASIKEQLAFERSAFIGAKLETDKEQYPLGYMAAFNWSKKNEIDLQKEIIADGINQFQKLFGFPSLSFVASQSIWSDEINPTLAENGVRMQVGQQLCPQGNDETKLINKVWGTKNSAGQIHWRRNCTFEPSRNQDYEWVKRCLQEIEIAFRWGKPAVINSHRVNYIGSIFPENRAQSLEKLKTLLTQVQKRWPEVEFIDTERLGKIMLAELVDM
jgi:hypothetical protein